MDARAAWRSAARAEALPDADPPAPGFGPGVIRIHPERILAFGIDPDAPRMTARNV